MIGKTALPFRIQTVMALLAIIGVLSACANGSSLDDGPLAMPDRATFPLVSSALERRCATLDCHGAPGRNLRLYTGTGLRLDPEYVPGTESTTDAEHDASYRSLVGLEPALMSQVVSNDGDRPERLTLLRKARGTEHHEPGAIIEAGDSADRCITSWLASAIDEEACELAAELTPPEPWPGEDAPR